MPAKAPKIYDEKRRDTFTILLRPPLREKIELSAAELDDAVDQHFANLDEFVEKADVRTLEFEDGSRALTANNVEDFALAEMLGVKNGDVLTSVNNEPVGTVDEVMAVLQKYRNASVFRIGILREGRPQLISYRVERDRDLTCSAGAIRTATPPQPGEALILLALTAALLLAARLHPPRHPRESGNL